MKTLLFVMLCATSVVAQQLQWSPLTSPLPGADVREIFTSNEYTIAVSSAAIHSKTAKVGSWTSNPLPNSIISRSVAFAVTQASGQGPIVWAIQRSFATSLDYSTDLGVTWQIRNVVAPLELGSALTPLASADGSLILFGNKSGSVVSTVYRTVDTARTFIAVTADTIEVKPKLVVEMAGKSIVVLNSGVIGDKIRQYRNGQWTSLPSLGEFVPSAITTFNNSIVVANDTSLYEYASGAQFWKKHSVTALTPKQKTWVVLKASTLGDVFYAQVGNSGDVVCYFKNADTPDFVKSNLVLNRPFVDAVYNNGSWLAVDQAGAWNVRINEMPEWASEGMIEFFIWRFVVAPDNSSVVAINTLGDVFYKSLTTKSVWSIVTPRTQTTEFANGHSIYALNNQNFVMFVNRSFQYSTNGGASWQYATFPENLDITAAYKMLVLNSRVFIVTDAGILVSQNNGVSYELLGDAVGIYARDFAVVNDTTVALATSQGVEIFSPRRGISYENPTTGYIERVLYNENFGYTTLSIVDQDKIVVSRKQNEMSWVNSDSLRIPETTQNIFDAALASDNTLYFSTYSGLHRLKPNTTIIETLDSTQIPELVGGLFIKGSTIYRAKSPGKIETSQLITSVNEYPTAVAGHSLSVYPQPASTSIKVEGLLQGSWIIVVDFLGRIVTKQLVDNSSVFLNVSTWPSGIFIIFTPTEQKLIVVER